MVLAACVCQLDILYKYKKQDTMTMRVLSLSLRNLVFVVNVVANRKRLSRLVSPQCGPWLSFSVMTRHSDCMTTEISTEHGEMHADSSHPDNLLSVWVTYLMLASRDFCNLWNHQIHHTRNVELTPLYFDLLFDVWSSLRGLQNRRFETCVDWNSKYSLTKKSCKWFSWTKPSP